MRTLLGLVAWLADRANADIVRIAAGPAANETGLGDAVAPNRAGRLVPAQTAEAEVSRSLFAHWALWAAVALIVGILAVGYWRRRWRAARRQHPARVSWAAQGHDAERED